MPFMADWSLRLIAAGLNFTVLIEDSLIDLNNI